MRSCPLKCVDCIRFMFKRKVDERKMCVMKNVNNADENRPTDTQCIKNLREREKVERDFPRIG